MPNIIKPIDYILCEGPSDAEFVCLYIERTLGYSEDRTRANSYVSSIPNARFFYAVGQNRDALIIACGGCTNIDHLYNEIVLPSIKANNVGSRVVVIIDRDNKTDQECYDLVPFTDVTMSINAWVDGVMNGNYVLPDGSNNTINWRTYFSVIPAATSGAFENVLINSLHNSEPAIANEVESFFLNLSQQAKAHISVTRKEIKAKLDTMLVLIDPERIFVTLRHLFSSINLNDPNIIQNFFFLGDIVNSV